MKKCIYFLRSGSYDYIQGINDLYTSFDLVARGITDPPLSSEGRLQVQKLKKQIVNCQLVVCSPARRSQETAKILGDQIKVDSRLGEIVYSMSDFISQTDFYDAQGKPRVDRARKLFIEAFGNDRLGECYVDCIQRIESLLYYLESLPNSTIAVVGHGFFLKVVEIYLKRPQIKNDRKILLECFPVEKPAYEFCEGFVVKINRHEKTIERGI